MDKLRAVTDTRYFIDITQNVDEGKDKEIRQNILSPATNISQKGKKTFEKINRLREGVELLHDSLGTETPDIRQIRVLSILANINMVVLQKNIVGEEISQELVDGSAFVAEELSREHPNFKQLLTMNGLVLSKVQELFAKLVSDLSKESS